MRGRIPVDEDVVKMEVHDKIDEGLLDLGWSSILAVVGGSAAEEAGSVCSPRVGHGAGLDCVQMGGWRRAGGYGSWVRGGRTRRAPENASTRSERPITLPLPSSATTTCNRP